jgi:hypothetical protein
MAEEISPIWSITNPHLAKSPERGGISSGRE